MLLCSLVTRFSNLGQPVASHLSLLSPPFPSPSSFLSPSLSGSLLGAFVFVGRNNARSPALRLFVGFPASWCGLCLAQAWLKRRAACPRRHRPTTWSIWRYRAAPMLPDVSLQEAHVDGRHRRCTRRRPGRGSLAWPARTTVRPTHLRTQPSQKRQARPLKRTKATSRPQPSASVRKGWHPHAGALVPTGLVRPLHVRVAVQPIGGRPAPSPGSPPWRKEAAGKWRC